MKIILEKDQKLFFTSDTHYGHANICSATTQWVDATNLTRDFKSLEQMNDAIVDNINFRVREDDILIHLGDWSFGGFDNIKLFRDRINCKNIHLIYGNHDHHIRNNKHDIQSLFSSTQDYLNLDLRTPNGKLTDKFKFICMHYPIASWDGMNDGVMHLHGHVHLPRHLRIADGKAMDVGVDGNDLEPIEMDDILIKMVSRPIDKLTLPKDHHIKRI